MKKLLIFILTIIISIMILLLCISVSVKEIIITTLSKEVVKKEIASEVINATKEFDNSIDYYTLEKIEINIGNSSEIDKITEKYFDNIVNAIVNNGEVNLPNTKEEVYSLIDQNESVLNENNIELTDAQKEKIAEELTKDGKIDKIYKNVSNKIIDNMSDSEIRIIKAYDKFTSSSFRWIIIGIIIILTILIALIKKTYYRWTYNLAVSCALSGTILSLLAPFVLDAISIEITNKLIGKAAEINIGVLINLGYLCFALCAALIITYIIGNKVTNWSERKYNY